MSSPLNRVPEVVEPVGVAHTPYETPAEGSPILDLRPSLRSER